MSDPIDDMLSAGQVPQQPSSTSIDPIDAMLSGKNQNSPVPASSSGLMGVLGDVGHAVADGTNALATGNIRGLLRTYNPVDALLNVRDLGKVLMGTPMLMAGKIPPDWLQVQDRMQQPGSSERLIAGASQNPVTNALLNPANPSYEGGYLQNAGGAFAGIMSPSSLTNVAVQAARNATVATVGKAVTDLTDSPVAGIAATLAPGVLTRRTMPAPTTPKSATAADALANGYVLRPSDAGNTSWLNSTLEGFAGKAALNQDINARNAQNRAATVGLEQGIPVGSPVTSAALETQRGILGGQGYAPLNAIGDIPTGIMSPSSLTSVPNPSMFQQALAKINQDRGMSQSRDPTLRNDTVAQLTNAYAVPTLTGEEINTAIQQQRTTGNRQANTMYGGDVNQVPVGKARIDLANSLEDLVNEHLMEQGPSNVIPGLQAARKAIAQNYTVDNALTNPTSGEVNAKPFVNIYNEGKIPLSGAQLIAGKFGSDFPKANLPGVSSVSPQMSSGDVTKAIAAGLIGYTTGGLKGATTGLIPVTSSPVRNMLLSDWYQKNFANPSDVKGPWGQVDPQYLGALTRSLAGTGILSPKTPQ